MPSDSPSFSPRWKPLPARERALPRSFVQAPGPPGLSTSPPPFAQAQAEQLCWYRRLLMVGPEVPSS
jgi:hypothetical protein